MGAVQRSDYVMACRLDTSAWRGSAVSWTHEALVDLGSAVGSAHSPHVFAAELLARLLPSRRLRSWAVIMVDADRGLHRDPEETCDPALIAWAASRLWASGGAPEAFADGQAYLEKWDSAYAAEAFAGFPLVRDGDAMSLLAVWLTADDSTLLMRDASRLTVLTHLWRTSEASDEVHGGRGSAEPLTARQQDILRRMARGLTNAQIAQQINFSESTVRVESMCIYRHFAVHSRADAVAAARDLGQL